MNIELADELKWEQNMVSFGVDRFRSQERSAIERKDYTGTNGGKRLLTTYLSQVSEFLSHYIAGNGPAGRRRSKYTKLMAVVDADKIAMFALTEIITAVYGETDATSVARRIGVMIEDEVRFGEFQLSKPELFKQLQRDMDRRNSADYRHRHRVLTHSMNKNDIEWNRWSDVDTVGVGSLVLSLTLDSTDLVFKETIRQGRKQRVMLRAMPEVLEWIEQSDEALAVMLPDRMPTLIPPEDWTTHYDGGYHLPRLRSSTGLVKFRRGAAGKEHRALFPEADISAPVRAVNGMQRTPWRINTRVLETIQAIWEANLGVGMPPSQPYEIPASPVPKDKKILSASEQDLLDNWKQEARELHSMEKHRQSLVLGVTRTMRISQMLRDKEEFYYVYQLDFRGRVYAATSGVSPQGSDHAKGCLEFATAKPLGERGLYWLKVHGANKYGEGKSYDHRVAWIDARRDQWLRVAKDPVANRDLWREADKPYQFLAFCFDYAGAVANGPAHRSRLAVALDGSCNGLQHFSAMLRDPIGGISVNLVDADEPSDIYQDVANVATGKLRAIGTDGTDERYAAAHNWLTLFNALGVDGLPRAASKKPVMTLPYGSTQQACTSSLFSWYKEQGVDHFPEGTAFKHCVFMSAILWESIGEVVVEARKAMDWLQECAAVLGKEDEPLIYTSPLGFPVYQGSRNVELKRIAHAVGGSRYRLTIQSETEGISCRKQRQGSSPNLVHHVDAVHMMMCILAGLDAGIDHFAMIHDDFGTHACHIDQWHQIIREQFLLLHTANDILGDFAKAQTERTGTVLPAALPTQTLDLSKVLKSKYFFG